MSSRKSKFGRSVFRDIDNLPYDLNSRIKLYRSTKDSEDWVQRLSLVQKLPVHSGCVNCICWGERGDRILSGSDDQHLVVSDPFTYKVMGKVCTAHRGNIFSAKYLPESCDARVVSCSGEGAVIHTDLTQPEETAGHVFVCHSGTAYDVVTVPGEPDIVMSCGEDATVRCFDLRTKSCCLRPKCLGNVLVSCRRAATALAVNPVSPWELAVGCANSTISLYDRRKLNVGTVFPQDPIVGLTTCLIAPGLGTKALRITSIAYHERDSSQLLISYSSDHLYLFDLKASRGEESGKQLEAKWLEEEEEEAVEEGGWGEDDVSGRVSTIRRLRLRGDWSDTGPLARPHSHTASAGGRGVVQGGVIQRMSDVLSRMLNDPATRAALGAESTHPPDEGRGDMEIDEAVEEASGQSEETHEPEEPPHHDEEEAPSASSVPQVPEEQETEQPAEPVPSTSTGRETTSLSSDLCSVFDFDDIDNKIMKKPTVNLTYSDKGSTASTISMTVDDQAASTSTSNMESGPERDEGNNSDDSLDLNDPECVPSPPPSKPSAGTKKPSSGEKSNQDHTLRRLRRAHVTTKFIGHRNARTMIKEAAFWGDKWVMSGSDCGHVLAWEKATGRLAMTLQADAHVVNCVRPHPRLPILATAGIDYDIKLWEPASCEPQFDSAAAQELMARNAIMLEETRDTITVPATFMIRILACLNQLRTRQEGRRRWRDPAGGSSR